MLNKIGVEINENPPSGEEMVEHFDQDWSYSIDEIKSELFSMGITDFTHFDLMRMKRDLDDIINAQKGKMILETCMTRVESHLTSLDEERERLSPLSELESLTISVKDEPLEEITKQGEEFLREEISRFEKKKEERISYERQMAIKLVEKSYPTPLQFEDELEVEDGLEKAEPIKLDQGPYGKASVGLIPNIHQPKEMSIHQEKTFDDLSEMLKRRNSETLSNSGSDRTFDLSENASCNYPSKLYNIYSKFYESEKDINERPLTAPGRIPKKQIKGDDSNVVYLNSSHQPGNRLRLHDPVRMYEEYSKHWRRLPPPNEKNHLPLRNSIRKKLKNIEVPMSSEVFEKFSKTQPHRLRSSQTNRSNKNNSPIRKHTFDDEQNVFKIPVTRLIGDIEVASDLDEYLEDN